MVGAWFSAWGRSPRTWGGETSRQSVYRHERLGLRVGGSSHLCGRCGGSPFRDFGESVFSAFRPVWLIPVRSGLGRGLLTARARSGGWTPACVPRWVDPRELAVGFSASLSLPEALGRSPSLRGSFPECLVERAAAGSIPARGRPWWFLRMPLSARVDPRPFGVESDALSICTLGRSLSVRERMCQVMRGSVRMLRASGLGGSVTGGSGFRRSGVCAFSLGCVAGSLYRRSGPPDQA